MATLLCTVGFAEGETVNYSYKSYSGGFWDCQSDIAGGSAEFGFGLIDENKKNIVFRNSIYLKGFGGNLKDEYNINFGGLALGDKISFGGKYCCQDFVVRVYGFTGFGVGIFKEENHTFLERPLLAEYSLGGGFEFQFTPKMAFVLEFGGENTFTIWNKESYRGFSYSSPILTIGYRSLF